MTANQRRPGFRLPWSAESDEPEGAAAPATLAAEQAPAGAAAAPSSPNGSQATPDAAAPEPAGPAGAGTTSQPSTSQPEAPSEFLRDLVAAMRRVADEAREAGIEDLRSRAEQQVSFLEADAERRRDELRARAEADIVGVGEWARAEAERIRAEADQKVNARRAELERQLAAEATRLETESAAMRTRVGEYERELAAYHAQLAEINDPATFAAAAKNMPRPPQLGDSEHVMAPPPSAAVSSTEAVDTDVHPAEEEVLASRLSALGATAEAVRTEPQPSEAPVPEGSTSTDVVVKGLGSFGAITGFRQSLASVEGVDTVALSLGQSGEFVFRASHAHGFDIGAAITRLEGDTAKIEPRAEGGYLVTLERAR
jgi:hypothetical protein